MLEHLDNIISDINLLKSSNEYKLEGIDINLIENSIFDIKDNLNNNVDLGKAFLVAKLIYQLNFNNTFSQITDHISNEFYAFEFMLEQKMKGDKIHN